MMNESKPAGAFFLCISICLAVYGCGSAQHSGGEEIISFSAIDSSTFIEIERIGPRFYGGMNPVIRSTLNIYDDGTVISVTEKMYTGRMESSGSLSRAELEKLVRFIMDQGFFEMEDIYDCETSECEDKKSHYPPATPVTISVSIGSVTKKVKVTVLDKEVLDYPEGFDTILDRLNTL